MEMDLNKIKSNKAGSKQSIAQLVAAYRDLEKTLTELRQVAKKPKSSQAIGQIDLKSLIERLSQTKNSLERKIGVSRLKSPSPTSKVTLVVNLPD